MVAYLTYRHEAANSPFVASYVFVVMKLPNLENYHSDKIVDAVKAAEYLRKADITTHTTKH